MGKPPLSLFYLTIEVYTIFDTLSDIAPVQFFLMELSFFKIVSISSAQY